MGNVCEDLNNNVNIITIPNENVKCLVTAMYKYYTKNGNYKRQNLGRTINKKYSDLCKVLGNAWHSF